MNLVWAFWQQQLLGKLVYRGEMFASHANLHRKAELTADHFHRWLYLFTRTIDDLFSGPKADAAKWRAANIARSMQKSLHDRCTTATEPEGIIGVNIATPEGSAIDNNNGN